MKPDAIAITAIDERHDQATELTFRDLEREVARWAEALRNLGVGVGDRVAGKSWSEAINFSFESQDRIVTDLEQLFCLTISTAL